MRANGDNVDLEELMEKDSIYLLTSIVANTFVFWLINAIAFL